MMWIGRGSAKRPKATAPLPGGGECWPRGQLAPAPTRMWSVRRCVWVQLRDETTTARSAHADSARAVGLAADEKAVED